MKNRSTSIAAAALLLLLCSEISQCVSICSISGCVCSSLHSACLPGARLTSIPRFPNSTTTISIHRNSMLSFITDDSLKPYTELTHLHLESNNIRFISYSAFEHNKKLLSIHLSRNGISELQPYTFRNLSSLQTLRIDDNNLRSVRGNIFYGLKDLTTLSMKNNDLNTIHFSSLEPLKSLKTLDLSGNSIVCNCEVAWMKNFSPLILSSLVCSSPPSLAGCSMNNVTYSDLNCVVPSVQSMRNVTQVFKGEQGVELQCLVVEGKPRPKMMWLFRGEKLNNSLHYRLPGNGSLIILTMLPQLAGEYFCRAQNLMGNATASVHLEYAGSRIPRFQRIPTNTHVFIGSSLFLPCEADEITNTYHWVKDGRILSSDDNIIIRPGVGLEIQRASKSHSGIYYCVAANEEGMVNISAMVNVTNSVITCDGILSPSMMQGVRERIDLAFNKTQEELLTASHSPRSLLRRLKFPESGIIEHLKAAEIFDQAIMEIRNQLLKNTSIPQSSKIPEFSSCELEVLSKLSGCEEHQKMADCSSCFNKKYRTLDGTCNNLDSPLQGAAEIPFLRLLDPAYEDRIGLPVGWSGDKPSARKISRDVISTKEVTSNDNFTLMLMQFGQFLDHDMDLALGSPSNIAFNSNNPGSLSSCDDICHNDAPCFPIPVPDNDPRIDHQCLPFTRSSAVCGTGASSLLVGTRGVHREQINALTSYVDGSMIYSPNTHTARKLRKMDGSGKLLKGDLTASGKRLLPFDNESLIECTTGIHANRSQCFLAGDMRTNEQVGLTSMHTLFYREHNRVVDVLTDLNPHWNGERLYQEARKIVIAEWQHMVFSEYLPKILGEDYFTEYRGYDPNVDASIANAFATAAYRFGHSQIMPLFHRLDKNYRELPIGPLKLRDAFFAPFRILEEGGIDPLVRGLISTPVKRRLSHQGLNKNLTEALFAQANEIALDLAALNIQRGRDHGLPGYNAWRTFCNLSAPNSIEGLQDHITNATVRRKLRDIYGDDPDNIDLWVGGLLEDTLPGTQLGPTFQCIIGNQFRRLRDGDRFFYERDSQFTPDQLVQIKQASISRVICDNADDIDHVPVNALILQKTSEFVSCNKLPRVDLLLWKECSQECEMDSRSRRSILLKSHANGLRELEMKISQLEEKIGVCKFNGKHLKSGESWNMGDCTECTCQNGEILCKQVKCTST